MAAWQACKCQCPRDYRLWNRHGEMPSAWLISCRLDDGEIWESDLDHMSLVGWRGIPHVNSFFGWDRPMATQYDVMLVKYDAWTICSSRWLEGSEIYKLLGHLTSASTITCFAKCIASKPWLGRGGLYGPYSLQSLWIWLHFFGSNRRMTHYF